ncbi:DUF1461 domain-containing protein [Teredinibacter sp. KSP-S5-2]|uniref:lipoprotein intramolecular transacylase Lit n=1 Tax=Teredinibacter sp. KSP-S5-2 TaxID=3034506 RepID=UPI00293463F7|nr:DUF1461 domain-containing protein [Teredinibacter sp. KSP-S5-2]WNO10219.1 DUF1461 domain-containing protein [Teredinibacter sp. KSP-S5-2]
MNLKKSLFSVNFSFGSLVVALVLSWALLAVNNFFYGVWHDFGGIKQGIEQYGPQNRYKLGFAETTKEERARLFSEIVREIHTGGKGLEDIQFTVDSVGHSQRLLRQPEVVHLLDVAHLIEVLAIFSIFVFFVWGVQVVWVFQKKASVPSFKFQLVGLLSGVVLAVCLIFIIGPDTVFSWAHETVFPDDHQWFFYYQESLMSTLMLAPIIFAYIAVTWTVLATLIYIAVQFLLLKAIQKKIGC